MNQQLPQNWPQRWPQHWIDHDKKIKPYLWSHRAIGWTQKILSILFFLFLLFGGHLSRLDGAAELNFQWPFVSWLVFFGILALTWEIVFLPFDFAGYQVERRFGLSKQNVLSWLWDKVKGGLVGVVLGTVAMGLVYFCVTRLEENWWFACATLFIGFSIVLAQLAPVVLIPLFFKLKPMEEGELKTRLLELCRRFKIEVKEIYHLGLGEKTEKGNAAFTGLGRTKRIMIGDTLYEKYPAEQVEAVFAHELGHQVHNDLWKGIGFSTLFLYAGFYFADVLARAYVFPPFGTSYESPLGILLFFVTFGIIQMPVGWMQAAYSRARERAADRFASETIGVGKDLAKALERLTEQNYGLYKPNAIIEFFTYSHPAPWRRILPHI